MSSTPAECESDSEQTSSDNAPAEAAEANSALTEGEGESFSADISPPHSTPVEPTGAGVSQDEPENIDISQSNGAVEGDYLTDEIDAEDEGSQMEAENDSDVFKVLPKGRKHVQSDESVKSKKKPARGQNNPTTIESDLESD